MLEIHKKFTIITTVGTNTNYLLNIFILQFFFFLKRYIYYTVIYDDVGYSLGPSTICKQIVAQVLKIKCN